ncbi:retropepsin-like aspartic protease [Asaia prunellae]|uniref:retropepsin-like aspartic protease n=1 Tax=Asaia prunellae TaxID=610245 RepID=UPI00131F37AD|nr:retropepsin-like aspartic protease [Asaia prunellae]
MKTPQKTIMFCTCLALLPGNAAKAAPAVQGFDVMYEGLPPVTDPVINPVDKPGIFKSIEAGDRPGLLTIRAEILARSPYSAIDQYLVDLADAGLARINGDFRASDAALDRGLRDVGRHADTSHEINAILLLGESIRRGNFLLRGDVPGWINHGAWLERTYFAPTRAFFKLPNLKFPNLTLITPLVPASKVPEQSILPSDDEQLPLRSSGNRVDGQRAIDVEVQANLFGTSEWVVLDTGSANGMIPASYVARFHLPVIARSSRISDGFSQNIQANFVIVPEIKLGKTILRNQLFSVSAFPRPVLGLAQLGQLRHLTIDSQRIRFGTHAPFDCRDPLRASSAIAGVEFRLLFPYLLDGTEKMAVLDTGDNSPSVLSIRTKALPASLNASAQKKTLVTVAGPVAYRTVSTTANVQFTHFAAQASIKYIQSPMEDILIPSGILRLARFSLDMNERVACLMPVQVSSALHN